MVQRAHLGNDKTENEVQVENKQDFPFYVLLLYVLTFEKCISLNHLLFTGGCHQHTVWLRHQGKTGEWLTGIYNRD